MCVANIIFGQERLTEQFLSMHFFYDSVILFTKRCSSPSEHFAFSALFLWEHSLCAPEGAERQWAAPGENSLNGQIDEILFETLSNQHWDHHHKFTVAHRLCQPMLLSDQYDLDLKPPSFIWCKGIHALQ